jgi:23S rRNA (uridine2552-2'-O)-methyltransferase
MKSSKSKKVNRAWLHDHLNDPYVKQAQKEGYRARAAYKLKEIDEAFKLVKPGQVIVDLGATPGAWSQYLRRKLGDTGTIVALDILDFEPVDNVHFIQGDFRDDEVLARLEAVLAGRPVDLVVSDMAPNLSGIPASDAARISHLVELAVDFAGRRLRPDGALVCKVFHGSGYSQLAALFKQRFRVAKPIKPKASRDKSAETFLVGLGIKPQRAEQNPEALSDR